MLGTLLSFVLMGAPGLRSGAFVASPPAEASPSAPATYDDASAERDVATLMSDSGRAYLDARARLEANPALAITRLVQQLDAPIGPAERQRVLHVLAAFGRPEHARVLAHQLKRASLADPKDPLLAAAPWREILRSRGSSSIPALLELVGDRDLALELRAALLDDLVTCTPREDFSGLVALIGRGHVRLQESLRRALHRISTDPDGRTVLRANVELAMTNNPGTRKAALIAMRASLATGLDETFTDMMIGLALDERAPFAERVSAIRVLAQRHDQQPARVALAKLAEIHLAPTRRSAQHSEIIGWLTLGGLPVDHGARLVQRYDLVHASAPRLAGLAYTMAPLSRDQLWLPDSQEHPWPEVRQNALSRVVRPCTRDTTHRLASIASPVDDGGDPDESVARAAVVALGRCGDEHSRNELRSLLLEDAASVHRRAEAARQLARYGGMAGVDVVAKLLSAGPARDLGPHLANALAHGGMATPSVRHALCGAKTSQSPELARAAKQTLAVLFPEHENPC